MTLPMLYTEPKNKGTLVFLLEFGAALQEEWQQITRAAIRRMHDSVVHVLVNYEVAHHVDLGSVSCVFSR